MMGIDLSEIRFDSTYLKLIEKYQIELGPNFYLLINNAKRQLGMSILMNLTVKGERMLFDQLDQELSKFLIDRERFKKAGGKTPPQGHNDHDLFIEFHDWFNEVCTMLRTSYPDEDYWERCLSI